MDLFIWLVSETESFDCYNIVDDSATYVINLVLYLSYNVKVSFGHDIEVFILH